MTLREIVVRAFTALGEPSDLPIYRFDTTTIDVAAAGWTALVDVVNQAQLELAAWKFPDGHQLRMRLNDAVAMFQTKSVTATLASVSGGLATLTGLTDGTDLYKGQLLTGGTSGASALVLSSFGAAGSTTVYLVKQSGTFTPGETVTVRDREYRWNAVAAPVNPAIQTGIPYVRASGRPLEIVSVTDVDSETDLERHLKTDTLSVVSNATGRPASFVKIPSGVRLDIWPDATYTYMVRYARGPALLAYTDADVEPEVPAQMHRALELMAIWWGYRRAQESTDAYAVKRDLDDFLRRVRTEYDLQDEYTSGQIKVYPEGR